jgi:hypothetical protein
MRSLPRLRYSDHYTDPSFSIVLQFACLYLTFLCFETMLLTKDAAWRHVTYLTVGYMISRGLAKAGSRERYRD